MDPLLSQTIHSEVNNDDTPSSNSVPMENYGATEDHEQASLISGLTVSTNHTEEETHATTTVASSYISNASSASHYFQQQQQLEKMPTHNPSDSLDYSTTSSTNSIPPATNANENRVPTPRSYLGSIVRSLGHQQAFPSSMFPGQKLISPVSSRETIQVQDSFFRNNSISNPSPSHTYPSYYYFPISRDSTSSSSSTTTSTSSTNSPHASLPLSYQNSRFNKNVYQKRRKPGFCQEDDLPLDGMNSGSRLSAWRKCWRCFFSPRVLVTLLVCGVIVFNLLRLGSQQHQNIVQTNNKHTSTSIRGKVTSSTSGTSSAHSSSESASTIDAEYVKLEVIGGGKNKDY